jgi:hypothetical protein
MNKITFLILTFLILIGCENEESIGEMIPDGTYKGTFQREIVWSSSDAANITLTFSSNQWSGFGEREKYPALCHGTYSINGDTIIFRNECFWTAEFDWSLMLAGKYVLKQSGNTVEFSRDYRSSTSDTYIDRFRIVKQN